MRAEQAIFTSLRTTSHQGYHLAARSPGIGEDLAQQLRQWSPSHGSLLSQDVRATSLNSFAPDSDWIVVSRTMYGAPEYSGRGALQVVTVILAIRRPQIASFDGNPLALARTALTLGYLRLPATVPERLPLVTLPDRALLAASSAGFRQSLDNSSLDRALRLLREGQRVALVDVGEPLDAVARLFESIPPATRQRTSFTTGLQPSSHRPFQLHVLPQVDAKMQRRLSAQGIYCAGPA